MDYFYEKNFSDDQLKTLKELIASLVGDFSFKLSPGVEEGENVGGIIIDMEVEWIKKVDTHMSYFTIKLIPTSELLLSLIPIEDSFKIENYIYSKVFSEFTKFQNEKNVLNLFKSYPVFYKTITTTEGMLVFENLRKLGYRHTNRHLPLDYSHMIIVIREYARLHALSLAIREQRPDLFEDFVKNTRDHFHKDLETIEGIVKTTIHRNENALKSLDPTCDKAAYAKYSYYVKNALPIIKNLMNQTNRYAVIGHIDTGISNFLFKYKDNSDIPADVSILDWQHSRLASPAVDLATFIFSASDKTMRYCYDDLILQYYKSLSLFLKELGSDAEKLLPFQILQDELKTYGILGLQFAVQLIYTYATPKLPNVLNDDCHKEEFSFIYELGERTEFDKRVRDVIVDFEKFGYNFC